MASREGIAGGARVKSTLLFALLLLLFIQLMTIWIEGIYRLSLVKLEMGKELFGVLLLLVPLTMYCVNEKRERGFLWLAVGVLLGARAACPMLHAAPLIVVAGLGVAAFLIVLCYALSERYRVLQGDMGVAAGIAVLLSVCLRSMRASLDISIEGMSSVLGWLFVMLAAYLFWGVMAGHDAPPPNHSRSFRQRMAGQVGLFASFALIYLVLSSPAVVNAWCGGVAGYVGVVACTAAAFGVGVLWLAPRMGAPSRCVMLGWNVLFTVSLVGGILMLTPALPPSPASGPAFVRGAELPARMALGAMLVLSTVVVFNVRRCAGLSACARPRDAVLPVLLGIGVLFALTLVVIFTNVWGYVPCGRLLRNRFYLPFLLVGIGTLTPLLVRDESEASHSPVRLGNALRGIIAGLALLAVLGAFWRSSPKPAATPPQSLRVLTYNMQQGSHSNSNRDYMRQLALLRRLDADIIGLQECDTARPSGANVDPVRYFADSLGYYSYYGPNTVSGTFGAAILSRYPIRNPRTFFTYSDSDEIGTAAAEIDVGGTLIAFFSNHPSGGRAVKDAHVEALLAEAAPYTYVVALGDFNFRSRDPYFSKLAQAFDDTAASVGEANVNNHGKPLVLADEIDHIFVSRNFRVLESHYLQPPESFTDHPAHWAVLQIE